MLLPYDTPEENLVSGIFQQAIEDLWEHPNSPNNSLRFFLSSDHVFGSFSWCCEILKLNYTYLMGTLAPRIDYCIKEKTRLQRPRKRRVNTSKLLDLLHGRE